MLIGYARVSTDQQSHALQLDALRGAGCERVFVETASGARTDRPELTRLLEMARPGDVVACWRLDRLGRSLRHLMEIGDDLQRRSIGLRSLTESIDTTTPTGRLMFAILGALASMERETLIERTRAGLAAAAARGRVGGRPRALDDTKLRVAQALVADGGLSMAEIAQQVGCAPSTLYRSLPGGRGGSAMTATVADGRATVREMVATG
ncbi:recombinase family protein [Falsiroseomonas sp. E2-1-a20]|uniref:recombinase family protein n=1 Tax=Falsiroseomonas sp. E2-1-a20 TaxID=3239300 RepID=UPI003F341777